MAEFGPPKLGNRNQDNQDNQEPTIAEIAGERATGGKKSQVGGGCRFVVILLFYITYFILFCIACQSVSLYLYLSITGYQNHIIIHTTSLITYHTAPLTTLCLVYITCDYHMTVHGLKYEHA